MKPVRIPDGRIWLRVADPEWQDPLDPSYAAERGGRWNPPNSFETLYLNGDVATARMQIEKLLEGSPVRIDDLDDDAWVLIAARLPRDQDCLDAVSDEGVTAAGLPGTYPCDSDGAVIGHAFTQAVGRTAHEERLRGVWCRSACSADGRGRELAWFPATSRSRAHAVWRTPRPLSEWRDAATWGDLGVEDQPEPA